MLGSPGREVVEVLLREADAAYGDRAWRKALEAAEGAVRAAKRISDAMLLVRALYWERNALWMLGDPATALVCDAKILAMAEDPATRDEIGHPPGDWYIAMARCNFVQDVLQQTSDPDRMRQLLGVLDTAEHWLIATGHSGWRAGLLLHRARIQDRLGDRDKAVGFGQEALDAVQRAPSGAPGYTIGDHRVTLADFLRRAGRDNEAVSIYEGVLDDQSAQTYERVKSHTRLAEYALGSVRTDDAVRHATAAVRLAEAQNDHLAICDAIYWLVEAHRIADDLDGAWRAASRYLDTAQRDGRERKLYYAERTVVDLALDRGDIATADGLMDKLKEHGLAIDRADGRTEKAVEVAQRYRRLANARRGLA